MSTFEWEVFKRTGNIEHYLMMKEREQEIAEHGDIITNPNK